MTDTQHTSRQRKVTLRDVAALAGVSIATASKALNGRDQVSEETRRRVIETAERLSFTPNSLAQAILQGRSGTVGLLTNDLDGRFSLPILMGAEDAFGAGQMSVLLCDARDDAIREQYHLKALLGRQVDGLIVVGSRTDPRPSLTQRVTVPVIYAYAPSNDPADSSVVVDSVRAGRMAAEHLVDLGRRRIAHITGDHTYAAARDRVQGTEAQLADSGLALVQPPVYGAWTEAWGRTAVAALLDDGPEVDAIVCGSDQIARGVLEILHDRGVRVPDDIAVVGFDNWAPMALGSRPAMTTIDMRFETMGRRAAQRLFAALEGEDHPGVEAIEPRLVVRGSTVSGA
ncbi:LacI family DNA-binding transcriptional regulator [Microbacterium sp. GXF7504]